MDDNDPSKVIAPLRRILVNNPDHLPALEILARAQWRCRQDLAALETLARLIQLNPYEPGYHYLKGLVLQSGHQFQEARIAYERCLSMGECAETEAARTAISSLESLTLQPISTSGSELSHGRVEPVQRFLISWTRPS